MADNSPTNCASCKEEQKGHPLIKCKVCRKAFHPTVTCIGISSQLLVQLQKSNPDLLRCLNCKDDYKKKIPNKGDLEVEIQKLREESIKMGREHKEIISDLNLQLGAQKLQIKTIQAERDAEEGDEKNGEQNSTDPMMAAISNLESGLRSLNEDMNNSTKNMMGKLNRLDERIRFIEGRDIMASSGEGGGRAQT